MVAPIRGGLDRTPAPITTHWLSGCDPTPAIVSVDADRHGRAHVWRRTAPDRVELDESTFPNWFLTTSLELLAHLSARHLPAAVLRDSHGELAWAGGLCVVHLEGAEHVDDAYRYLVLTEHLDDVETAMVETANKADGGDAHTLGDLRGLVLASHPIEQYLLLTGRTYYKGLHFGELRRLQFDLETSGLNDERDRIFMVSLRDSTGWHECLDTTSMSEARLIECFVELVRERDPDVVENHNIFAFDLPFLVRRAARYEIPLPLGRDGSEPRLETDLFDGSEPFL
ncbi:MAG TPA: 3'-5' exonuclease, partial [Chloroflexota bacterium]|nr:3'-5' exonuclease [Chloroflexota bacterium]